MELFNLEDEIMRAWTTVEDIDNILWALMDRTKEPDEDEVANLLIGLSASTNIRMQKLFASYERVLKLHFDATKAAKAHAENMVSKKKPLTKKK
jgi:hypothetical protein